MRPRILLLPAGAYVDDSVITAKVKAAFVEDSQARALKIKVATKKGVVTLAGTVPKDAGQHALQLAAAIDGVKDVKSALTVKAVNSLHNYCAEIGKAKAIPPGMALVFWG
jgi:osmotically-inducible protein OsmY